MSDFWHVASTNLRACRSWRPFFNSSEMVLAACVAPRSSSSGVVFSACWKTNFSTCGATSVPTTLRSMLVHVLLLCACRARYSLSLHVQCEYTTALSTTLAV